MAVVTEESTEYANIYSTVPAVMNDASELHGRLRIAQFTHDQVAAGDATSSVALVKLPPGKITLLAHQSGAYVNWTTATATLNLGWDAYTGMDGVAVVADIDGIDALIDVELAGFQTFGSALTATGGLKSFESREGVVIRATSTEEAIVIGDDLVGYLIYIND